MPPPRRPLTTAALILALLAATSVKLFAAPANDNFANAQALVGNSGSVLGTNLDATGEPGEPDHYYGSSARFSSVWYRWTPSQDGLAVFTASSSTPSLVLAAYSGSALGSLRAQSSTQANGDGGSVPAEVLFRVTANTTYSIALGSYYGGGGSFTLSWSVTQKPVLAYSDAAYLTDSRGVTRSNAATLTAGTRAIFYTSYPYFLSSVTYQWNRDGVAVAGSSGTLPNLAATGTAFTINNVQPSDAGTYTVTISNAAGSVTSAPVVLAIVVPPPNDNFSSAAGLTGSSGSVPGTNVNATDELGEPAHWNTFGSASSVWYLWVPPSSGLATFDTNGSSIDTVLAVYTPGALAGFPGLTLVAADDDHGNGGGASRVSFAAGAGAIYYIAVGGATATARGAFTLNWRTSPDLAIAVPPANQTAPAGGSATFSVTVAGTGFTYQWNRNGVPIPGATSATLRLTGLALGADASYSVTVTDRSGSVTSAPATLTVTTPAPYTFATRRSREGAGQLWSIAASPTALVAVGDGGVILSSFDNALTWTPRVSGTTNWLVGVTYGAGRFVAVGDHGVILVSTDDGQTWRNVTATGTTQRLNNILYADGLFVAVGEAGTIVTSPEATNWSPRISNVTGWLRGLAYNPQLHQFATTGQSGVFLTSTNGAIWDRLETPSLTANLEAATAVDGYAHFVAIGSGGTVVSVRLNNAVLKTGESVKFYSTNVSQTGTAVTFRGLAQGASALFATGEGSAIVTATSDTSPWFQLSSPVANVNLLGGLYYRDTLLIVGGNETILQSAPILASRLINLSTRAVLSRVSFPDLNCGFVVTGPQSKSVLIRAAGPALTSVLGLAGSVAHTYIELTDGAGRTIASNTGWSTAPNSAVIAATTTQVGAFPFPVSSGDSALLVTLAPGAYVAAVGSSNGTGIAVAEIYDADSLSNDSSRAINISTRGQVGGENSTMIAGFVLEGAAARRVLIRGVGPTLKAFFVTNPVAETRLELFNSRGLLHATAGAWGLQANADEIRGSFDAAGAFKLADGTKDSAMVVLLQPGLWTVQLSGANGASGAAMVEVYVLP